VQPPEVNRSALWRLLACLALILILAAALSPVLFWLGKGLLKALHESGFSNYDQQQRSWLWAEIAKADFPRFFNRSVLIAALAVLPFYLRGAGFKQSMLPRLKPSGRDGLDFAVAFVLAGGLLLELGYWMTWREVYVLRVDAPWWGVTAALIPALSVAVIEEILFRGFILGLFLKSMSARAAAVWTTAIFAAVHFMKPAEGVVVENVEAGTGFWLIASILANFARVDFFLAEFCTLVAVGWVLVKARLATGQLWLPLGLHAGWVFGLKYFSALTKSSKALKAGEFSPWIGENLRIGLLPLGVVLLTGWFALQWAILKREGETEPEGPDSRGGQEH